MTEKLSPEKLTHYLNRIDLVRLPLQEYLEESFDAGFPERSFYAETFLAASISDADLQDQLVDHYFSREPDAHEEFNLFALQKLAEQRNSFTNDSRIKSISFRRFCVRIVSNWVLLRSLVRIRRGGMARVIGLVQAILVLVVNNKQGRITDNTLRSFYKGSSSLSSQYHAFATFLVGEIFILTKIKYFKRRFLQGVEILKGEVLESGEFAGSGRGAKQIFGYASLIGCFQIAYELTGEVSYLDMMIEPLNYLRSFQKPSGEVPLALVSDDELGEYWYSYNNKYDYMAFLHFVLTEIHERLSQ